ncbi:MAG: hypothetical protein R3C56_24190 [Pirellulaceae bacterium]
MVLSLAILAIASAYLAQSMQLATHNALRAERLTQAELVAESVMNQVIAGVIPNKPVTWTNYHNSTGLTEWLYELRSIPTEIDGMVGLQVAVQKSAPNVGLVQTQYDLFANRWIIDPALELDVPPEPTEEEAASESTGGEQGSGSGSSAAANTAASAAGASAFGGAATGGMGGAQGAGGGRGGAGGPGGGRGGADGGRGGAGGGRGGAGGGRGGAGGAGTGFGGAGGGAGGGRGGGWRFGGAGGGAGSGRGGAGGGFGGAGGGARERTRWRGWRFWRGRRRRRERTGRGRIWWRGRWIWSGRPQLIEWRRSTFARTSRKGIGFLSSNVFRIDN